MRFPKVIVLILLGAVIGILGFSSGVVMLGSEVRERVDKIENTSEQALDMKERVLSCLLLEQRLLTTNAAVVGLLGLAIVALTFFVSGRRGNNSTQSERGRKGEQCG
jgi:hypothetical protein